MKGKKIECASAGVDYNRPLASNSKSNIMSAARQRKRGGAVAKTEGVMGAAPKMRMDKAPRGKMPKRAKGGGVSSGLEDAGRKTLGSISSAMREAGDKGDTARSGLGGAGRKTLASINDAMRQAGDKKQARAKGGGVSLDKQAEKTAGKMLASASGKDRPATSAGRGRTQMRFSSLGREMDAEERAASDKWNREADERKRGGKVERAAGGRVAGKIGVDTHPVSSANRTRPMRGHSTQPNIT